MTTTGTLKKFVTAAVGAAIAGAWECQLVPGPVWRFDSGPLGSQQ
jgi:hypothetical protein